jgi:hypothetical protein
MNSWFEHNLRILQGNSKYLGIVEQLKVLVEKPVEVLYSKEDAQRGADKSIRECLELYAKETVRSIVITGFEYGFLTEKVLECMPMEKTAILILESDIQQLRSAMYSRDLSHIFLNEQIFIYVEPKEKFEQQLTVFIIRNFYFITHRVLFLENPMLRMSNEENVEFLRRSFTSARQMYQFKLGNSPEDTLLGNLHNTFNLKQMIGAYPFNKLQSRFSKVPAICVAAGPSLEKNLDLLKGMQDHVLIFACDTIMEKLLRHGIEPHFVASLERNKEVYDYFFNGRSFPHKTILLGLSLLYPSIYEEYAGAKVIVTRNGLSFENWIQEAISTVASVNAGQSVAHLNYTIAKELGCEPIILIGQDLAYGENGHTHVQETYDEIKEFADTKGIVDFGEQSKITVKGFYGGMVESLSVWEMFRKWFEDRCREDSVTLINATEGGCYIEGALHMSLSEVLEKYCHNKIDLTPLEEIRNHRLDEKEFSEIGSKVYFTYKTQLELNFEITKELEGMLLSIQKISSNKNEWFKNNVRVVSRFQQLYEQFIRISTKEQNILNTIQFKVIHFISKINRMGAIDTFEEVETICLDLSSMVSMTIYYTKKTAEIYEAGLKVLSEYSDKVRSV